MSTIPASQLVQVNPNVLSAGGNAQDIIGLVLTKNTRVPIGTVKSFPTPLAVSNFFGASAQETTLAGVYFNGFDNSNVKPGAILFAQYPASAVAAYLQGGNTSTLTLTALQALNGSLNVNIDGYLRSGSSINLSASTSFSSAAGIIQTGLNASPTTQASFTGSISGTVLTVSAISSGALAVGQTVQGTGITANSIITSLGTGTGGTGTYNLSQTSTVSSESMTTIPTPVAVTFDSVSGSFIITSGITGTPSTIAFASGTLAPSLFLTQITGAVTSQGAAATTPAAFMNSIIGITQNWATFMTAFDPDGGSGNAQKLAFAQWVNGTNNQYAYICWDTDTSPTTTVPATSSLGYLIAQAQYSGTELIWEPTDQNYAAFICGSAASIDFTQTNGRITFAFKGQSGLTPTVTDPTTAANLLANGYNFYGAYATANQQFNLFQNGSISGIFKWLDSYINQIWLNNNLQLSLMNLLSQTKSIPYNQAGYSLIESACLAIIQQGLNFGAFRAGVTLSATQIANVNNAAGKNIATTLQNQGWYLQIKDAAPTVRQARGSPPINFWYVDGQSVQKISLASIDVM
jgi:hypothetical protein